MLSINRYAEKLEIPTEDILKIILKSSKTDEMSIADK